MSRVLPVKATVEVAAREAAWALEQLPKTVDQTLEVEQSAVSNGVVWVLLFSAGTLVVWFEVGLIELGLTGLGLVEWACLGLKKLLGWVLLILRGS